MGQESGGNMSWWPTFKGMFTRGGATNLDRGQQLSGPTSRMTEADITVSDDRAMAVSAVYACISQITNAGASLPLQLFTLDERGNRDLVDRGHFARVLLERQPNKWQNALEFRQAMWMQRVTWGNAYARIDYSGNRPISITPLRAEHVRVCREDWGMQYEYTTDKANLVFKNRRGQPFQILHWRGFSPDGIMGMSPLAYARQTMGVSISATRYASKSFKGRPNAVLEHEGWMSQSERDEVIAMTERMQAASNGQWWLFEGGTKFKPIMMPPDDLQMLETQQFSIEEVARFFNMPPAMIGGSASSTASWPASYTAQQNRFKTTTLQPYMLEFENKIHEALGLGEVGVRHDTREFLRGDAENQMNIIGNAVVNGVMTRNEGRQMLGLPTVEEEGADNLTVQLAMSTLEDLPDLSRAQVGADKSNDAE